MLGIDGFRELKTVSKLKTWRNEAKLMGKAQTPEMSPHHRKNAGAEAEDLKVGTGEY